MKIAFDIDDTLLKNGRLCTRTHHTLRSKVNRGHDVIVWSARGEKYASDFVKKHKLKARVAKKGSEPVDLAYDDQPIDCAKHVIKI